MQKRRNFVFVMMKKFVVYILLIAFGVLFSPRDLMHECDHHDAIEHAGDDHQHDNSKLPHFDDNCFACDYDMDLSEKPLSFFYRFQKQQYSIVKEAPTYLISQDEVRTEYLRGPPNA